MAKIYYVAFWFMTLCRMTVAVNWLALLPCIKQLFGSLLDPDSSYPAIIFHGFSLYLQTGAVIVPQIRHDQACFQLIIYCNFIN